MDLKILSNNNSEYIENKNHIILKNNQLSNFKRLKTQKLKTVNYSNLYDNNFEQFKGRKKKAS